jgi:hypothetical protein
MNENMPKKFMEIGRNKLHLMLLQLKIDSANSVGKHLQPIMSKEFVWETGIKINYFILLFTRITMLFLSCHG